MNNIKQLIQTGDAKAISVAFRIQHDAFLSQGFSSSDALELTIEVFLATLEVPAAPKKTSKRKNPKIMLLD